MDLKMLAAESYEARGILHSEMAIIIATIRAAKCDTVIETGRYRGQSTYIMAKYLPDVQIHSIERRVTRNEVIARRRLEPFSNVTLHMGEAVVGVPELIEEFKDKTVAILFDGPKGFEALSLLTAAFESPHVVLGFIHDMRKLDHGEPSLYRAAAAKVPGTMFSDDPDLVSKLRWMDKAIMDSGGPCGSVHESEYGSYGPTVGAFFNKQPAKSKEIHHVNHETGLDPRA